MHIKEYIKHPTKILLKLDNLGLYRLSDEKYLKMYYKYKIGKKLDLDNPKGFNEKLQWLKLHDKNPDYIKMVDKYEVKSYISKTIGKEYLIPTIGIYNDVEEIDFNSLPDKFVIKCTHDSGSVMVCKDKKSFDIENVKKRLKKYLKRNYYYGGREWPYKNIQPRIIIEEYMVDKEQTDLNDYKFLCFNGKMKCSFVCTNRYSKEGLNVTFFDRDWHKMPFERHYPIDKGDIKKPKNYELMIKLAEELSQGIPFVRVDFYEINNKVYFGELTFFPGNGFEEFTPDEWDYKLGEMIDLSVVKDVEHND